MRDTRPQSLARQFVMLSRGATLVLLGMLVCIAVWWHPTSYAAAPEISLMLLPPELTLAIKESVNITVLAKNPGDVPLRHLRLTAVPTRGVIISTPSTPVDILLPSSEFVWTVPVTRTGDDLVDPTVQLRLDYDVEVGEVSTARTTFTTLKVVERPNEPVAQVAKLEVLSTLTGVNAQRPGVIYVVISNLSNRPITLNDLDIQTPDYLLATSALSKTDVLKKPQPIDPGMVQAIKVDVQATQRVQPSRQLLLITADLSWMRNGQPQHSQLVAKHELDVSVFGESDLTKLLGVPSFFFIPGVLILAVLRFVRAQAKESPNVLLRLLPTDGNATDLLAFSVTASLLVIALFWLAGRNLLDGYGLYDILTVWSFTILGTLGGIAVVEALQKAWMRMQVQLLGIPENAKPDLAIQRIFLKRKIPILSSEMYEPLHKLQSDPKREDADNKFNVPMRKFGTTEVMIVGRRGDEVLVMPKIKLNNLEKEDEKFIKNNMGESIARYLKRNQKITIEWEDASGKWPCWVKEANVEKQETVSNFVT